MTGLERAAHTAISGAKTLVDALPGRLRSLGLLAVAVLVVACKGGGSSY